MSFHSGVSVLFVYFSIMYSENVNGNVGVECLK